jgi:hypothetical protein
MDKDEALKPAPVEPDWKAEYLKSVESGCITLDELRETLAELDATDRQVEILSDALAESRREVAALNAAQPAPVQPVAHRDGFWCADLTCKKCYSADFRFKHTTPPAQPAVPDALTSADIQEHIEYVSGWNDCRQAMLEMMK